MKKPYLGPALLAAGLLLHACTSNNGKPDTEQAATQPPTTEVATPGIQPVEQPDPGIAGYHFPESTDSLNNWIQKGEAAKIALHGWGLWTSLCAQTSHVHNGDTLRVYQTWLTKYEIDSILNTPPATANAVPSALRAAKPLRRLVRPAQFGRDPERTAHVAKERALLAKAHTSSVVASVDSILETVGYNKVTADIILKQKLFFASSLDTMLAHGQDSIQAFPNNSVVIKPMYEIVPGPKRAKGRLFQMKVWTGPAGAPKTVGYYQNYWPNSIYIDINGNGKGDGHSTTGGPTPATTYNLNDFMHYQLTAAEAHTLAASQGGLAKGDTVQAGDYAVLVGMHITTKEISRWTWQTFWWTPDPDHAPDPSSATVIAARPTKLTGAPRHYAMSISYQMISPVQPNTGGNNKGNSVYTQNPYLEAPFGPSTFASAPGSGFYPEQAVVVTNGVRVVNNLGIHTNCMSCHAQASYVNPKSGVLPLNYLGDTYVDPLTPKFKGRLRTDFLWSISDKASFGPDSKK